MTAHWGIPDPAAVEGTEAEIALAFKDAFRMLQQRIGIFAALPIRALDKLSLQAKLKDIGQMEGATGKVEEPALMPSACATRPRPNSSARPSCSPPSSAPASWRERLAGGNVALALLVQHAGDRRHPGRADPDLRRRSRARISIRPSASPSRCAANCRGRRPALYIAAQVAGRHCRRVDRASDVRPAGLADLDARAHAAPANGWPNPSRPSAWC